MNQVTNVVIAGLMLAAVSLQAAAPELDSRSAPTSASLEGLAKASPAQIRSFFNSPEYRARKRTDAEFVTDVYQGILRRAPDPKGFNDWVTALRNSQNNAAARQSMVNKTLQCPEYTGMPEWLSAANPPKKDKTRNPANVIFNQTGMFVNEATAFPADVYATRLLTAGVGWVSLQIDNGGAVRQDNVAAIEGGWADRWRAAGFKVGFWGCPRGVARHGDPSAIDAAIPLVIADAELGVKLSAKYHADHYLADVEDSYQAYNTTDPAPMLNRVYVEAYKRAAARAGITTMARALSSMGRIALDMKPWIEEGWDAMPQAYWNSYAVYQPSKCVDFYVETGWPIGRIHPTIGTFTGEGENRTVTLEDYAKDLATRKTVGFSYFLPEAFLRTNEAAYRQLGQMGGR